jgi:DNA-directed RNA polymerase specialized sigma subunit
MGAIKERVQKTGQHIDDEVNLGSNYTDDEVEFLKAIEAYKAKTGRKFPTWCEVLAIARNLGYAKNKTQSAESNSSIELPIQISYFS